MASSSFSHSAFESSSRSFVYDVFLSFRGVDTRKTFVDHLYSSLIDRNIYVYKDDESLPRGESIGPSLFKAIEESHIAIIIFSKSYVNSSWCLEELTHIIKCKDEKELIVIPVFYDVHPSEIRKPNGKVGKEFTKDETENITKTEVWKKALVNASNIAGWELKNTANGQESIFIKRIVDTILDRLPSRTEVDEDLVGINVRFQDLKRRLEVGSGGVRMVGIWGIGGSGKTTLATSLCLEISHHFQRHYIVENIREESSKLGLKKLQENILSIGYKSEVKVQSVAEGKSRLKRMFHHSNVLLVLDDVDDVGQLDALAGSHNWFSSGSRIIITTRDEHLLKVHRVDEVCRVILLSNEEAIQLFNKRACNTETLIKNYETLSLRVVSYAAGLPLALKVLGSFLYDKDNEEWLSSLARLNHIPETKIVEKLKISYDGLKVVEKDLFLDIACFFRGKNINEPMEIFKACGYHPKIGIKVLRQKALINIVDDCFVMHDLVQEMGHYIVRGEYPQNPEQHSRVWKHREIRNMCLGDATKENEKIEAICYEPLGDEESRVSKIVSNMKKLRWLSLGTFGHVYTEGLNFFSNELRYIQWMGYPTSSFPGKFEPMKLVVLKLDCGLQKELWKGYKCLPHLKVLRLEGMMKLHNTPDFDRLPCLKKLTLLSCGVLEDIHPSLGRHSNIECVVVRHCHKLRMFPTIVEMNKLNTLQIEDCGAIQEFPEIQTNLGRLETLSLDLKGIKVLPSSIGVRCSYLGSLQLGSCVCLQRMEFYFDDLIHLKEFRCVNYTQFRKMPLILLDTVLTQLSRNLQKLNLSGWHLKDGEMPSDIVELSHLQELDLSGNDFTRLEFSLLQLTCLKVLKLVWCRHLVQLPELPSSVAILKADKCSSLTTVGDCYTNSKWLCQVSLMKGGVLFDADRMLETMLLQGKTIENCTMSLKIEGLEIAKGFRAGLVRGSTCGLKLAENWCNDFSGFLLCSVFADYYSYSRYLDIGIRKQEMMSGTDPEDVVVWEESRSDKRTVVCYVPFASLRDSTWWKHTSKTTGSFSINTPYPVWATPCSALGVRLVARNNGSCLSTAQLEYEFSPYTPEITILQDTPHEILYRFNIKSL